MWNFSVATLCHKSLHKNLFEPEICLHSVQLRIWSTGGTPRSRAWHLVCPCCCCSRWQRSASSVSSPTCCLPSSASPSPFASTSLWSRLCRSPATDIPSSKCERSSLRCFFIAMIFMRSPSCRVKERAQRSAFGSAFGSLKQPGRFLSYQTACVISRNESWQERPKPQQSLAEFLPADETVSGGHPVSAAPCRSGLCCTKLPPY